MVPFRRPLHRRLDLGAFQCFWHRGGLPCVRSLEEVGFLVRGSWQVDRDELGETQRFSRNGELRPEVVQGGVAVGEFLREGQSSHTECDWMLMATFTDVKSFPQCLRAARMASASTAPLSAGFT